MSTLAYFSFELGFEAYTFLDQAVDEFEHAISILTESYTHVIVEMEQLNSYMRTAILDTVTFTQVSGMEIIPVLEVHDSLSLQE